jgi:superfamily II DNA or RNA helicase
MQCGRVRFFLSPKKAAKSSPLEHKLMPRLTDFTWTGPQDEAAIHDIYNALVADVRRNDAIIEDVRQALLNGRSPVLLTSRTQHLDYLAGRLRGMCQHIFVLKGGMGTKQRKQIAESFSHIEPHESRMLLATGSYLGEGFDDARLDTLFLTMPISWRGTLQQYVGRLHRLHENKREVLVYDYADVLVPMLARMYKKRLAGYSALGYKVVVTADQQAHAF